MISITSPSASSNSTANVLPCRIRYTGPANASQHLWRPRFDVPVEGDVNGSVNSKNNNTDDEGVRNEGENGKGEKKKTENVSYFRGRKLFGRRVKVPEGFAGHVLRPSTTTEENDPPSKREHLHRDDDEDEGESIEKIEWSSSFTFDEIVLWGHEAIVDPESDGIAKGVIEWMGLAAVLNGYTEK